MDLFSSLPEEQQKEIVNEIEPEIIVDIDYLKLQDTLFHQSQKSNPFYNKNVVFSDKLLGNKYLKFQIIGNLGGWVNETELSKEVDFFIISKSLKDEIENNSSHPFLEQLNSLLNVYSITEKKKIRNYKFKKLQIISEESFLKFIAKRCKEIDDRATMTLIDKIKES